MSKRIWVTMDRQRYPLHIGAGLLNRLPQLFAEHQIGPERRLLVISDTEVAPLYAEQVMKPLQQAGFVIHLAVVPAGEESKNLNQVERLIGECLKAELDRSSLILALGGGVVGDLAGFVAASYMRGIDFVQLPTTLLAHDSSVGGKVGVNHPQAKNYIGAFHQPIMVVYDVATLHTLPSRELYAGFAEVIKHGLIADSDFVSWLEQEADALLDRQVDRLSEAIYRGCAVKAAIVSEDEKERGKRAYLNYGHTIGHALEAVTHYQVYRHGEAVAIGLAGAAQLSQLHYGISDELVERTENLLTRFQLPTRYQINVEERELLLAMQRDKKARNRAYTFVLAPQLGQVELVRGIAEKQVKQIMNQIRG